MDKESCGGFRRVAHSALSSNNKRMCVRTRKKGWTEGIGTEREGERDLKPTGTSYLSEGATTEIDI